MRAPKLPALRLPAELRLALTVLTLVLVSAGSAVLGVYLLLGSGWALLAASAAAALGAIAIARGARQ